MRIDHLAMYVNDLEASKEFYMRYFGAVANRQYHNPKTGLKTYFLTFDDGARLEIMNRPDMSDSEKPMMRTGFIHLSFSVGSKEKVDELTHQLATNGYKIVSGPRTTGDGCYESVVLDKENNQIEITE